MTNNSTKSRAGYVKKFTSLGLNVKAVSRGGQRACGRLHAVRHSCVRRSRERRTTDKPATGLHSLRGAACWGMLVCASCGLPRARACMPVAFVRPQEEVYSSSYAAAAYLESINFKKKVRHLMHASTAELLSP